MADSNEIRARVDAFVEELSALVQQAVIEKIQAAIGQTTGERPRRAIAAPAAPRAARPAGPAAPARRSKGKRGGKRTPEELGQMAAAVLQFVENNPNANIEEIGRGVGLATKDLALPVRKLLKEGRLKKRGEKRATRYNAGGRGGRVA